MADKLITFEENGNIKASEINYNYEVLQRELTERLTAFDEYLKNEVDKAKGNFVLPGTVMGTPSVQIPEGYLLCDGSSYLRETYPDLFKAIKDTYGADDDYHFNVPDFRGMFLRGAGGDSADIGLVQECAVPNIVGSFSVNGTDPKTSGNSASGAFVMTRSSGAGNGHDTGQSKAVAKFELNANETVSPVYKDGVTEVRPINQSINWIIKC